MLVLWCKKHWCRSDRSPELTHANKRKHKSLTTMLEWCALYSILFHHTEFSWKHLNGAKTYLTNSWVLLLKRRWGLNQYALSRLIKDVFLERYIQGTYMHRTPLRQNSASSWLRYLSYLICAAWSKLAGISWLIVGEACAPNTIRIGSWLSGTAPLAH